MGIRAMTIRLPADRAAELEAVARADGVSLSEAARTAVEGHIASRRADREFQARIRRMMEEEREVLARLAQ